MRNVGEIILLNNLFEYGKHLAVPFWITIIIKLIKSISLATNILHEWIIIDSDETTAAWCGAYRTLIIYRNLHSIHLRLIPIEFSQLEVHTISIGPIAFLWGSL